MDGKQIQNVFKALGNCLYEIYLWRAFNIFFLTALCNCLLHIPSGFWLRNLSFLMFFIIFFLIVLKHFHDGIHPSHEQQVHWENVAYGISYVELLLLYMAKIQHLLQILGILPCTGLSVT